MTSARKAGLSIVSENMLGACRYLIWLGHDTNASNATINGW